MEKAILHCDLNNFFATVECRDHAEYAGHPVAVCGSAEDRHGIVLAKNELAKKYGVKTAEPIWQAQRKCPGLVLASPHFKSYLQASEQVREIYFRFTNQVEPFGIDECWLDVTGSRRLFGSGYEIAEKLRALVKQEAGLTISVGVSFNKIFAKLASDFKKPDATTVISQENFKQKIWPLPANYLLGVGKSTDKQLWSMGISTIGELAMTDAKYLTATFGKAGQELWVNANGLNHSPVQPNDEEEVPKSVGNSITCVHDLHTEEEVWRVFLYLAEKISRRMREAGLIASGIQISVKDNLLHVEQHQQKLEWPTRLSRDLAQTARELFQAGYDWQHPVRALGICAISLLPENYACQASFFHNTAQDEKTEMLETKVEAVCGRFGKGAVIRASLMNDMPIPGKNRNKNENENQG
jgi:DNA polymerase-4